MARQVVERGLLEDEVQRVGREVWSSFPSRSGGPLEAIDRKAMELAERDRELRAALFRLVDVTPACRSLDELAGHLKGYLAEVHERPASLEAAMRVAGSKPGRKALGAAAAAGVRHMAHRFIVGETPRDALGAIEEQWKLGIATSLDQLGEATVTQEEADRYAELCRDALETLADASRGWPSQPLLEADPMGEIARANLSVKVTALTPLMHPEAPEVGREDAARRLRPLLRTARERRAHLHVDMESVNSRETTQDLVLALLDEPEFQDGPSVGVVVQAYLRDSPDQLERLLDWSAASHRPPLTIRLVKGAYWDHEVVEARRHGWRPPVFESKAECDRNFEQLTRRLLDARPQVRVAVGSHNLRSLSHAIAYDRLGAGEHRGALELQVLRGLGDDLARALAAASLRVRAYCPVGDLLAGMAYLVRRLLENTANESFLHRQRRGEALEELLTTP